MPQERVFISYVRKDSKIVDKLKAELEARGIKVWIDRENIDPGVRWKVAIRKAIRRGSFFIACFSRAYAEKTKSYMNEELTLAIEEIRRRQTDKTWFIPALLSDCEIPDRDIGAGETLRDLHYVELHKNWDDGVKRIISVIQPAGIDESEMVLVPAGEFLYGDGKDTKVIRTPFYIDIYPVTNKRFKKFIDAGGYTTDNYWSEKGKRWRAGKVPFPEYWHDPKWNQPDHPVVGVSYYEAEAFAKWAGKRLPDDLEWERAARGTDGREYLWGDVFDPEKCNTWESGIKKTTPVTRYPEGKSPAGCYDMAGNVWEWAYGHSLRGGCWNDYRSNARCAIRNRLTPYERVSTVGFRCVRTVK